MTETDTFYRLKGWRAWHVTIFNNYYAGRYTDYGGRQYAVIASSPEQALQVVVENSDAVLTHMLTIKDNKGKKILPKSKALPITLGALLPDPRPVAISTYKPREFFTPEGKIELMLENGFISGRQMLAN